MVFGPRVASFGKPWSKAPLQGGAWLGFLQIRGPKIDPSIMIHIMGTPKKRRPSNFSESPLALAAELFTRKYIVIPRGSKCPKFMVPGTKNH